MLKQQREIDAVILLFATWISSIRLSIPVGRYSATDAEFFSIPLLNIIYDCDLQLLSDKRPNFPAIDLGDDQQKISFQITTRTDTSKIVDTVELFMSQRLHEIYPAGVKIFILKNDSGIKLTQKTISKLENLGFNVNEDIIYPETMIKMIRSYYYSNTEKFIRIKNLLFAEFGGTVWTDFSGTDPNNEFRNVHTPRQASRFVGMVPQHKEAFEGRVTELEQLDQLLKKSNNIVILHGLPGIGKSTLLKIFIQKNRSRYDRIIWIDVKKNENELNRQRRLEAFYSAFNELDTHLKMDLSNIRTTRARFELIINHLCNYDGLNLLVIDNVGEEISELIDYLPGKPNWHVAGTARHEVTFMESLPLYDLDKEASIILFRKWLLREVSTHDIEQLLGQIGCHPLMLELVAKTLNVAQPPLTIPAFLVQMRQGDLAGLENVGNIYTSHNRTEHSLIGHLLFAFSFSVFSTYEKGIVKQWYYLLPTGYKLEELHTVLLVPTNDRLLFSKCVEKLCKSGWLQFEENDHTYTMHPLFQKVVWYSLSPKITDANNLITSLSDLLEGSRTKEHPKYLSMAEFTMSTIKDSEKEMPSIGYLYYCMGYSYARTVQNELAVKAYQNAANLFKQISRSLGDDPTFISVAAEALKQLSMLKMEMNLYSEVYPILNEMLSFSKKLFILDSDSYFDLYFSCMHKASIFYLSLEKKYKKVIKLLKRSLYLMKEQEINGKDVQEIRRGTLINLAVAYQEKKDWINADKYCWDMTIQHYELAGKDRAYLLNLSKQMWRQASLYQKIELFEEAEIWFTKSVNMFQQLKEEKILYDDYDYFLSVKSLIELKEQTGKHDHLVNGYIFCLHLIVPLLMERFHLWKDCIEVVIRLVELVIHDTELVRKYLKHGLYATMFISEEDLKKNYWQRLEALLLKAGINPDEYYSTRTEDAYKE